ncbi:FKBP12-associated protein [Mortierella sp. AD011]|nr:FKBP12-associated protein [Mortierella sp. AD011]
MAYVGRSEKTLHSTSCRAVAAAQFCIHPSPAAPQFLNANIPALGNVPVVTPPLQAIPAIRTASHALHALSWSPSSVCAENQKCQVYPATRLKCHVVKHVVKAWIVACTNATDLATLVSALSHRLRLVLSHVRSHERAVATGASCKCGNLTKEIICGASAENSWDGKPRIIKCNDFCLIAERNKRVALALDIDDSTIRGPRIPHFDNYVLDYASANMEFTLKIEKRLAEWVSDSTLQTLNLQPMKGHHRKFVHELASHYNVTSESVDVEPYRSVVIHKKLNTSVPDVLASQACRQRRPNTSTIGTSGGGSGIEQLRKSNIKDPINAIYLHDLANGLTRAELSVQLAPIFGNIKYGIRWLTDDDAVLVPHPGNMTVDEFEVLLVRLRTGIKSLVTNGQLCERVELCWMNKEGEVVGHTNVGQAKRFFNAAQGNQLMKKPAPPKVENAFSILDDDERVAAAKKVEEEIVMKAKEAAGTLSLEAWGEDANNSFSSFTQKTSRPPSAIDAYHSEDSFSSLKSKMTRKADQNVVDDWQELLDDDVDDDQY